MNIPKDERMRVLLIPDRIQWILGTIAKETAKWNPDIDFTIVSDAWISRYINAPGRLFQSFDVVHFIGQYLYPKYKDIMSSSAISTVHHVVDIDDWEALRDNGLANVVTVSSNEWKKYLLSKGIPESKIFLMPYGIDTDVFTPLSPKKRGKLRQKAGLSEGSVAVGFFANSSHSFGRDRKGTDVLFDAFRMFRQRSNKEIVLVLSGIGWERYAAKLSEYNISYIYSSFIQNYEDIRERYGILDCYLITSRIEGGPVPLLEAMSCEVPVITTPVGMAIDIIKDGFNGLMIPKDSPEAVTIKLIELIGDPDFASSIAKNARNTIVQSYRWQDSTRCIPSLYQKALDAYSMSENAEPSLPEDEDRQPAINWYFGRRKHLIEEELLWAEYLATREPGTALKTVLMLCVCYPWNLRIWRHLLMTMNNKTLISFLVRLKSLLRKLRITQ